MHIDSASAYCDGDGDRKLMMMLILVLIVMLGVSNVQLHMYRCTVVPLYRTQCKPKYKKVGVLPIRIV